MNFLWTICVRAVLLAVWIMGLLGISYGQPLTNQDTNRYLDGTYRYEPDSPNAMRLGPKPTYCIVAPVRVRPGQTIQIYVTLFESHHPFIDIYTSIRKETEEITSVTQRLNSGSSQLLQMQMPVDASPGNYSLVVRGSLGTDFAGFLFQNETKLQFNPKQASIFVMTDRILYNKRQWINFRVIAIQPNLSPVDSATATIYVKDPGGRICRRWINAQLYSGYYEDKFYVDFPVKFGMWRIEVESMGHSYHTEFKVENWFGTRFDVNLTVPTHILDIDYGLTGTVMANLTNGMPVKGNATIQVKIKRPKDNSTNRHKRYPDWVRPPIDKDYHLIEIQIGYMVGLTTFTVPLSKIKELVGDLPGTEISVHAEVYDWNFMENKTAKASCVILSHEVQIKFLGGRVRTFKPGEPVNIYVGVFGYDGSPIRYTLGRQVTIQASARRLSGSVSNTEERGYLIPDDSIVRYTYQTHPDDQMITIYATYRGVSINLVAYRFYSKQGEYLTVSTSTDKPKVDHYMVYTVRTSVHVPEVQYMMVAKGNILAGGSLYMTSRQKTFSLALSRDMIPYCRLVVYAVLMNSAEIIADSINMHVKGDLTKGIRFAIKEVDDISGDVLDMQVFTEPSAFVFTTGADYEMYNRGLNPMFTEYMIEEELASYDDHTNHSFKHTWYLDDELKENVYFNAPSYAVDANTTFSFSGLTVFTDADLVRNPISLTCNMSRGRLPCFNGQCYLVGERCDGSWQCDDGADEMGCEPPDKILRPNRFTSLGRTQSNYDDATWLWHRMYTQPNGLMEVSRGPRFPSRPAWWVVSAVCLSQTKGLMFYKNPYRISSIRRIYMHVELPSSAFTGEQLGVQVALFNYYHEFIELLVQLRDSDDYRFVQVEEFGRVSSYSPRTTRGDHMIMVYLLPGESRYIHFPILPIKLGKVKVVVDAICFLRKQTITKTVSISHNGVQNLFHTPYMIDLIKSGSLHIQDLDIAVPEQFVIPGRREHLYVPGSAKSVVSLVGDVLGPGLPSANLGAWNLLHKSSGQGESYIFDFAIDLYWLRVLKSSNSLSNSTLIRQISSMNKDLTIFYSYMKDSGAYAMFRNRSPASVWITAYALETLVDATVRDWEDYLFIDVNIVNKIASWLASQRDLQTGAFKEPDIWFDRKMLDPANMTDENGMSLNISLTAYVTIALAKSQRIVRAEVANEVRAAVGDAAEYLSLHLPKIWEPFQLCITTYALFLAKHNSQFDAFRKMEDAKRENEYVYWSEHPIPSVETNIIDTIQYLMPRDPGQPNQGKAVQGTAYALMVYLMRNDFRGAVPIMKWLQTQRNRDGGFVSTQDTTVALQALTAFSDMDSNRRIYNMEVNLQVTSDGEWKPKFLLHKGNFMDYNTENVPIVFGSVRTLARGTGYALLQLTTTVNVEYDWLMRKPVERAFDLEIAEMKFGGRNGSRFDMSVCVKWLRTDWAPRSGYVMIEVDIPTGYKVAKQTLRDNERWGPYNIWKRSRFTRQKVYLHIDYIPAERTCFRFHGHRWYPVANATIQHKIQIYELYEPGNFNSTLYTTYELFHHHICQVCGSYQCPYCPYYNTSPEPGISHSVVLWWIVWTASIIFRNVL